MKYAERIYAFKKVKLEGGFPNVFIKKQRGIKHFGIGDLLLNRMEGVNDKL